MVRGPQKEAWRVCRDWNLAITRELFSGQYRQRPVYLDLTEDTLEAIGAHVGLDANCAAEAALENAVAATLNPVDGADPVFIQHLEMLDRWSELGAEAPPPCLALLALLSLVARRMASGEGMSATNYYGRLCQAIGIDRCEERARARLGQQFRRDTPELWDSLREWLELYDGELGHPTAEAFDRRRFIGLPMSQALVRAADREKLADLFSHFQLRPGQQIANDDMRRLIDDWIGSSTASQTLKRLCKKKDTARRIAEIARVELENWDGQTHESSSHLQSRRRSRARLALSIRLVGFPKRLVSELLVPSSLVDGRYRLLGDQATQSKPRLIELEPEDAREGRMRPVPGSSEIPLNEILLGGLRLEHVESGSFASRRFSRLIVLERDEDAKAFVETSNLSLGADCLVVAHESVSDVVARTLEANARPGYREWTNENLSGLTVAWHLFDGVQVFQVPRLRGRHANDLSALIPLSWSQVSLGGGLSLYGRARWHAAFPPEARLARSSDRDCLVVLRAEGRAGRGREMTLGQFSGAYTADLMGLDRPSGDYRILLFELNGEKRGDAVASAPVRLRSADEPRRVQPQDLLSLAHKREASDSGAFFALSAGRDEDALVFEGSRAKGMRIDGVFGDHGTERPQGVPVELAHVEDDRPFLATKLTDNRGGSDTAPPKCLIDGVHYWKVLETYYPKKHRSKTSFPAVCTLCGVRRVFVSEKGRQSTRRTIEVARAEAERIEIDMAHLTAPRERGKPSADHLLDAVSWQRCGSYRSFVALAEQVDSSPWFPQEMLQTLSSLGHIDYQLGDDLRPNTWSVAPVVVSAFPELRKVVLTGLRSASIVSSFVDAAETLGCEVRRQRRHDAPDRVAIEELPESVVPSMLVEHMQSVSNSDSFLSIDPDFALAAMCPTLGQLVEALPYRQIGSREPLEEYEVLTNRWTGSDRPQDRYAYVIRQFGNTFLFTDSAALGRARVGDYRVVKYLAAAAAGVPLLIYDPRDQILSARLGSPLPGLFERAAVACSGLAPRIDGNRVLYEQVRPIVASTLIWKLSSL